MYKQKLDSRDSLLCLALAAVIHGNDKGVRLCCERLYKAARKSAHSSIRIIHQATQPRRVTLCALTEYLEIENGK